ncbi:unnamed protein product [Trichobilharzia szidati]|nr:unnamed protein product [Trichobilharzia szidati]
MDILNSTLNHTVNKNNDNELDPFWISTLILLGCVSILGTIGNSLVLGVFIQHHFWPHLHLKYRQIYLNQQLNLATNNSTVRSSSYSQNSISNNNNSNNNNGNYDNYMLRIHESNEQLFNKTTGTPTFFILVLACIDLLVCCFVVPLTFYMEYVHLQPSTDLCCKAHAFLNICNIMFSSLLIIAIALERYLTICHPLRRILTMKRAKYLTLSLAIFCILYGILGAVHHSLGETVDQPGVKQCLDTPELPNVTYTQILMFDILQKGNTASFILSILFVIILYSLILRVVIKTHRINRHSYSSNPSVYTMNMLSEGNQASTGFSADGNSNITTTTITNNNNNDKHLIPHRKSIANKLRAHLSFKGITESTLWRELRSASVLFVVAVVYIIVFTPALLTANKLVSFNLLAYNTYYLNNMSNPVIYCFMSHAFRKKLKILLFNGMISFKSYRSKRDIFVPHHSHHPQHQQQHSRHPSRRKQQHFRARQINAQHSNNNGNNTNSNSNGNIINNNTIR